MGMMVQAIFMVGLEPTNMTHKLFPFIHLIPLDKRKPGTLASRQLEAQQKRALVVREEAPDLPERFIKRQSRFQREKLSPIFVALAVSPMELVERILFLEKSLPRLDRRSPLGIQIS